MKMNRHCSLPTYDSWSSRLEFIAFSGLGLAGVILITAAAINASRFARDRDGIVQAWSEPGTAQALAVHRSPDRTLTNLGRANAAPAWVCSSATPDTPAAAASQVAQRQWPLALDEALR